MFDEPSLIIVWCLHILPVIVCNIARWYFVGKSNRQACVIASVGSALGLATYLMFVLAFDVRIVAGSYYLFCFVAYISLVLLYTQERQGVSLNSLVHKAFAAVSGFADSTPLLMIMQCMYYPQWIPLLLTIYGFKLLIFVKLIKVSQVKVSVIDQEKQPLKSMV